MTRSKELGGPWRFHLGAARGDTVDDLFAGTGITGIMGVVAQKRLA